MPTKKKTSSPHKTIDEIVPSAEFETPAPVVNPPSPVMASFRQSVPVQMTPGDERTWGMLSHLSVLLNLVTGFGGPIAALIIYLVYKERSRYVAYHALQALVFQLIWWVGGSALAGASWAVSGVLSIAIIGLLCMPFACIFSLLPLGGLIYGVVGAVQTSQGQDFKYWLVGDWVRGTLTGK